MCKACYEALDADPGLTDIAVFCFTTQTAKEYVRGSMIGTDVMEADKDSVPILDGPDCPHCLSPVFDDNHECKTDESSTIHIKYDDLIIWTGALR